jgi:hypothetical protein
MPSIARACSCCRISTVLASWEDLKMYLDQTQQVSTRFMIRHDGEARGRYLCSSSREPRYQSASHARQAAQSSDLVTTSASAVLDTSNARLAASKQLTFLQSNLRRGALSTAAPDSKHTRACACVCAACDRTRTSAWIEAPYAAHPNQTAKKSSHAWHSNVETGRALGEESSGTWRPTAISHVPTVDIKS